MALRDVVERYLTECTRPEKKFGVSGTCLYSYYQRWCRGENMRPCAAKTFHEIVQELGHGKHENDPKDGFWYDLDVVETVESETEGHVFKRREQRKLERIAVLHDLHFADDEVIPAGAVLQRVEPNEWQADRIRHHYEQEKKLHGASTPAWMACLWSGRVVFLSGEDVERV